MKRILALSAAMLVLCASGAFAKAKVTTLSLDGQCDVLTIRENKVLKVAFTATDDPNCEAIFGAGLTGKDKFFGNIAVFGAQTPAEPGFQFVTEFSYPFVTGGSWTIYYTTDGVALQALAGGTYTVGGTPARGSKPVLSAFHH